MSEGSLGIASSASSPLLLVSSVKPSAEGNSNSSMMVSNVKAATKTDPPTLDCHALTWMDRNWSILRQALD